MPTIRIATGGDAAELADIYRASEGTLRAQLGVGPVEAVDLAGWFVDRLDGGSVVFLAERQGFIELVPPDELRALYVRPEHWGTGIAARLHDQALEHLHAAGASHARLTVFARNERARRFYAAHGWITDGEAEPQEIGGVTLAMVRCVRAIA